MYLNELMIIFAFALLVWFWLGAMRTRDLARVLGRNACKQAGVQFLDDSVNVTAIRPRRDGRGFFALERRYGFEFTSDGSFRYHGEIVLLDGRVKSLEMEPHRITEA